MRRLSVFNFFIAALALAAAAAAGDFPVRNFHNASIRDLGGTGDLEADFRALASGIDDPAWIGYAMPRIPGGGRRWNGDSRCGTLYLEDGREDHDHGGAEAGTFLVLLRVAGAEVVKVRAVSTDCDVDAGGLDVHAFSSVEPRQSLDLLVDLADRGRRLAAETLFAIAFHDEPAADAILERVALGDLDWGRENQAVLWLGSLRGRPGFEILERLARTSDDAGLRHDVTFGLHVSRLPEALEVLIAMARRDASRRVRRQALFWLSQEAGRRAVEEIERATEEDPDLEVKKYAIFALSQLPPDQGVPLLVRHARTHPHPEVRKKAMFWLGQSGDERALDFFEEILLD